MATGTIQFEKVNNGNEYRTAFYTMDAAAVAVYDVANAATVKTIDTEVFAPMYKYEVDPGSGACKVRSYEIYIDNTTGNTGDNGAINEAVITNRVAKVTTNTNLDATDQASFDIVIESIPTLTNDDGDLIVTPAAFTITLRNVTDSIADIRIVLVCEA